MSDAPERIWAVHHETQGAVMIGEWADTVRHLGGTEYTRADLCITTTEAAALVADALQRAASKADEYVRMFTSPPSTDGTYGTTSVTYRTAEAAILALIQPHQADALARIRAEARAEAVKECCVHLLSIHQHHPHMMHDVAAVNIGALIDMNEATTSALVVQPSKGETK